MIPPGGITSGTRIRGPAQPHPWELRAYGRKRLSAHNVPTQFLLADELPCTGAAKIDMRALVEQFRGGLLR